MELVVHTDGGSRGNPGPSAVGVVIQSGKTSLVELGLYIGVGTNNTAEYQAVITALTWIRDHQENITQVSFFLDSQLVVSQLNGVFAIKHPDMKRLKAKIDSLLLGLPFPNTFQYVPRAENKEADALVNQALDAVKNQ